MCSSKFKVDFKIEKKYRLSDFFHMHWHEYIKSPKEYIKECVYKAANAIMVCRTSMLGVELHVCEECGDLTEIYHSCHNRFCPTCSWKDTVDWAERTQYNMLKIKHRHVVFTLPHSLLGLIKKNDGKIYSMFMRVCASTLKEWILYKYNLKIGIIEVLHTYGEKKDLHPHVHMIVSWGGIDKDTGELVEIESEYVKYGFLQQKFRAKFEDELIRMNDAEELFHDYKDRQSFMQFIKRINKTDWVIHLEPSMKSPGKVIRYIGRYSKRACLSEYKITEIEGAYISFRYKDYKDRDCKKEPKEKILKLHYEDFFPRLMQHVPIPYFRMVRYYGLYSNHGRIPSEYKYSGEEESGEEQKEEEYNPKFCETCKREKIHLLTYFDRRTIQERREDYRNKVREIREKERINQVA